MFVQLQFDQEARRAICMSEIYIMIRNEETSMDDMFFTAKCYR